MKTTDEKLTSVIGNIYELIQKSNKKVGDLEAHAGVSTGYLSRQNKEGVAKLSFEFVLKAAEFLEVSIDDLISDDFNQLTPDERYLIKVLDTIVEDTKEGELHWSRETVSTLEDSNKPHDLFEYEPDLDAYGHVIGQEKVYKSKFVDKAIVFGDAFRATLPGTETEIIITDCIGDSGLNNDKSTFFFETYLVNFDKVEPLCISLYANETIKEKIMHLYNIADEYTKGIRVDKKIRGILDDYLYRPPF